jgi:hypothetical protein
MNPTKHVLIAMMLTATLFIIAGKHWGDVASVRPVRVAPKG